MYELKVTVTKVVGRCTADPPMKCGDFFTVSDGDLRIPKGGYVCMWALQSLIPLLTPKEREIAEAQDEDWMWRVHHAQCPDPNGRVVFKIERTGKVEKGSEKPSDASDARTLPPTDEENDAAPGENGLQNLRIEVESVGGRCSSRMQPGDRFTLCSGRLYIAPGRHFCLYALHAVLPLLPAKQRVLADGDWLKEDSRVICPDPAGNTIMRIDHLA